MAASTASDGNQTIGAFLNGFFGEAIINDVVQRNAAIAVHSFVDPLFCAQRGNDNGCFVFDAHFHVVFQTCV